eukprot:Gb_27641 [translate_table: standard]
MAASGQYLRLMVVIPSDIVHLQTNFVSHPILIPRLQESLRDSEAISCRHNICETNSVGDANFAPTTEEMDFQAAQQLLELRNSATVDSMESPGDEFESIARKSIHSSVDANSTCGVEDKGAVDNIEVSRYTNRRKRIREIIDEEKMDEFDERTEPRFRLISDIMLAGCHR